MIRQAGRCALAGLATALLVAGCGANAVKPAPRTFTICYVNAFQTQPDEADFWAESERESLLLHDDRGRPVVDGDWGEFLLDTRTAENREALLAIIGPWLDGCRADGFAAVELDNLDSWVRSDGLISQSHNIDFARLLTARAGAAGLIAGQKNWAELAHRGSEIGFAFAVAEECGRYDECQAYMDAYADRPLVVEYREADFAKACRRWGAELSIVLRDRDVTPGGVNRRC